jgi:hypothetical protein
MLWLTERVTRYSIGVTTPDGYGRDAMEAGLVCGLDQIPSDLLNSVTFDQGSEWACWETIAAGYRSTSASVTPTARGRGARSRTSTVSGAGASTARVRPPSTLQLPLSDR